jgi:thioredoxin reductase (NADPH)
MNTDYDVIIIGSGPAGLTAAIYTTRASLKTLVIAGSRWGGQLMLTSLVENFPGFPEGIQGPDLMMNMRKQAEHHGTEFVDENFTEGDFTKKPFTLQAGEKSYTAKAVIIASGADTKWLGVPGEQERVGKGVSSCATCDAAFFRGKNVIVVGGGDSAMEEASVLARSAAHVTLVHRRDSFKASQIMQDRVKQLANVSIEYNSEITEIYGENRVQGVKLKHNKTNEVKDMPIDGVFVAIGHIPNTSVFKGVELDQQGYIKVHDYFMTSVEGVFVGGDVHDAQYRQAITAAGFGCAAALETERWLAMQGK